MLKTVVLLSIFVETNVKDFSLLVIIWWIESLKEDLFDNVYFVTLEMPLLTLLTNLMQFCRIKVWFYF